MKQFVMKSQIVKGWLCILCLWAIAALFSVNASAESVRLNPLDRENFEVSCQYDVYFSHANTDPEIRAVAKYVSAGHLVFDYYNTLRVITKSEINEQGLSFPSPKNKLPVQTYVIQYRSKTTAYPFSLLKTVDREETGLELWSYETNNDEENHYIKNMSAYLAPGAKDTMDDIMVRSIVRHCDKIINDEPQPSSDSSDQEPDRDVSH